LKNVTFISLLVPIIILGVPITDTVYAMIRRKLNKKPISEADKHHLHHQLMNSGLDPAADGLGHLCLVFDLLLRVHAGFLLSPDLGDDAFAHRLAGWPFELFVESIGLLGEKYKPLTHLISHLVLGSTKHSGAKGRSLAPRAGQAPEQLASSEVQGGAQAC
jgi:UDP-GlcNAc:undecaprenyl-phosphate GlcNAc-1-phosphate transferase